MKDRDLQTFLGLSFAIGWFFMTLAVIHGPKGQMWLLPAMWAPLVAAVLAGRQSRADLWSRMKKTALRFWPVAALVGWSFYCGQQLLLGALQLGHWNSELFPLGKNGSSIDSILHVHAVLGAGQQSFVHFGVNLVLSLILSSGVIMIVGAIGERRVARCIAARDAAPIRCHQRHAAGWSYLGLLALAHQLIRS